MTDNERYLTIQSSLIPKSELKWDIRKEDDGQTAIYVNDERVANIDGTGLHMLPAAEQLGVEITFNTAAEWANVHKKHEMVLDGIVDEHGARRVPNRGKVDKSTWVTTQHKGANRNQRRGGRGKK